MRIVLVGVAALLVLVGTSAAGQKMTADHPNAQLVARFYAAFDAHDGTGMAAAYRPDVQFSDEVFPELKGAEAAGMWRMLCVQGKDLHVVASQIAANDTEGRAHWEAWYTFSATGRKVHNVIEARFTFKDGLIATHTDSFDFWAWSKQALGTAGTLLGWSPVLKYKIRKVAAKGLAQFLAQNP